MRQHHKFTRLIPVPVGAGVLLEIEYGKIETSLELLGGPFRNLPTGYVRSISPAVLDGAVRWLGVDNFENGDVGPRVLFPEPKVRYFEEAEYQLFGLEAPDPDKNGFGDLCYIQFKHLIAVCTPTDQLPFSPLGGRVFFEFDYDDESLDIIELDSGIAVQERHLAADNMIATVTGVGPDVKYVQVGDRVVANRHVGSIDFEGKKYFFVHSEHELFAVAKPVNV
ncbi:MAG: hypothetical protein D6800_06750 [Candidatus Zixiibacteriota bacterium]|nr:MAG: hypothetical protein D6800_06750 [candidate division Zixibacteria bacterium]